MRSVLVVPEYEQGQLAADHIASRGDADASRTLPLERPVESLHYRNAPMLPRRPIAKTDSLPPTPVPEPITEELPFLVRDEMPRGSTRVADGSPQDRAYRV